MGKSKYDNLFKKLNVDVTSKSVELTKVIKKEKVFSKVKDNIPIIKDYNFMIDILYLPTAQFGYKYLLVCVDLGDDSFDIEPMKIKTSDATLEAYKKMLKREYINLPKSSMSSDGGLEFKGSFKKYLKDNNIYQKTGMADRHKQQSNVERLNRELAYVINAYLNSEELEGRSGTNWTPSLDTIRKELNESRKKKIIDNPFTHEYPLFNPIVETKTKGKVYKKLVEPLFKVDQLVYYKSEVPLDINGKKQNTKAFREGDVRLNIEPKKITQIFYYLGSVPYRYQLEGITNVSYSEKELKAV